MKAPLPRGPLVDKKDTQLVRARYAARWLRTFWDDGLIAPRDPDHRAAAQRAFDKLRRILEDE